MPNLMHLLGSYMDSPDGPSVVAATRMLESELFRDASACTRSMFGSIKGLISVQVDGGLWVVPAIHAVWLPPHHAHAGRSFAPYHGWSAYVAEANAPICRHSPASSGYRACCAKRCCVLPVSMPQASDQSSQAQSHICAVVLDEISLPVEEFGLPIPADARLRVSPKR